ncbi:MAG: 50S ribosomal protein L15 [Phycisphaerales bacterium]|nr:50S ribosomal protein L15 [Phycisphaerales bacterium]
MMIHDITAKAGANKKRKRVGRGEGSGIGGTSTRGHNGAKSRAGWTSRPSYEGGQTPFARRFPKRGFKNTGFRTDYYVVNVSQIAEVVDEGTTVDLALCVKLGLVKNSKLQLKILGHGDIAKKLKFVAGKFSETATTKIEAAGGFCTLVVGRTPFVKTLKSAKTVK